MPISPDATLEDRDGRTVLRFERALRQPPDRVWRALTESGEVGAWHPSPFELEPRAGGAVRYRSPDGDALGDGTVTDWEPPRLLGYTWGDDHLLWELRPRDDGTLLVLLHTFDDAYKAARDAAGWHLCLDALAAALGEAADGAPVGWADLNRSYEGRFGIDPALATPPPSGAGFGSVAPLLLFTGQAEEALRFYAAVFPGAKVEALERYGPEEPDREGTVKHATLRLGDQTIEAIDSPAVHAFGFTPAVSLAVTCDAEASVDRLFARLSEGGSVLMPLGAYPFAARFGWVTDRFGVSWQLRAGAPAD